LAQVLGQTDNFKSYQAPNISTTTSGMPFVSCYLGVNDGVLYPLQEGLLFFKPTRFLPRSALHSIACGRGGGDASRYVDMVVQCNSKDSDQTETVEFTNIQREENSVLNSYIHDVLVPAMKKDAKEGPADNDGDSDLAEVQAVAADEDDTEDDTLDGDEVDEEADSDSNDEDFDDGSDGDSEDGDSSDEDDDIDYGEDDEGIAVVKDDFAQELVKRKNEEESATESEDEDSSQPRTSKRLRQK